MKIAVGLSGGVDSTMTAYLLKKQGHTVVGVTMSLWDGTIPIPDRGQSGCFGPGEARELVETENIAKRLGIDYEVIPLAEQYKRNVLDYFRSEYKAGRTPNPCVKCNQKMKFGFLIDCAHKLLDFDVFATGHYARVSGNGKVLRRAVDHTKDQTYFLSRLSPEQLSRVVFPLGELTKLEVKALAAESGFEDLAKKPESQDFIECDDYSVLFDKDDIKPGDIVDTSGKILGKHNGIVYYTIGQRKGLGIGGLKEPLFVVRLDPHGNRVVLGTKDELFSKSLKAHGINRLLLDESETEGFALAKIRHGKNLVPAKFKIDGDNLYVSFDEPQMSVTPGQIVALYRDDAVLASAIIDEAFQKELP